MKHLKIAILLSSLFFYACSAKYEQRYDTFVDFNNVNQRNKSWFSDFIASDAFDLKNDSYHDEFCAFGTFRYSKNNYYDSIFTDPNVTAVNLSIFKEKVSLHKDRRPSWFLETEVVESDNFESIKIERFYITRDKAHQKIYFVLSD